VTVAVLSSGSAPREAIKDSDLEVEWFSGTGKGGQHRNKHQNSCRVRHIPTGIVEARQGRKRQSNLTEARAAIAARVHEAAQHEKHNAAADQKKEQVGSGMRGDKTVTIRMQDDRVQHHVTRKTMRAQKYMKGFMDQVW
jgi:peptide chain release factor 1